MKKLLLFVFILCLLPAVLAVDLTVEKHSTDEVMILDLNQPATFNMSITNNGHSDFLLIYTFFGGGLTPTEKIYISKDETKNLEVTVLPRPNWNLKGITNFNYFIQGKDSTEIEEKLTVKIINLEDAFKIGAADLNPESSSIQVYIENPVNFNFENLEVNFNSPFFELKETLSLKPYEKKSFTIQLDQEDYNKLSAGYYTLTADVQVGDVKATIEGKINFVEKNILKTTSRDFGLIVNSKVISKTNEGNTLEVTQTVIKKNILSRLFTSFSPEPTNVNRQGGKVYYTWDQEIEPGESEEIIVRTNWLLPFLIIILVIGIVILTKKTTNRNLEIRKRISFVKAKGGEFALKVTIIIAAKKYLERVRLVDRLPPLVKMYERFGGEEPSRIDKEKKKLEWDFENLDAGEKRVVSYIVYSKVGVLGRFALPAAIGMFERDGKIKEVSSNKAFFLSQQKDKSDF
jgi:hypothetical protein